MSTIQILTLLAAIAGAVLVAVGYLLMTGNDWTANSDGALKRQGRSVNVMTAGGLLLGAAAMGFILTS